MFSDDTDSKFFGFPFFLNNLADREQNNGSKMIHDAYRVYVNNDYVGDKVLVAQNEKVEDVEKYLKNAGFDNFTARLVGNEYIIDSPGNETADMKTTLAVYFNNR